MISAAPNNYAEQGLNPLRDLLCDEATVEVAINTNGAVFCERADAAHMRFTDRVMSADEIEALPRHIASAANQQIGHEHPILSVKLDAFDQILRIQIVTPPAVATGASISIRRHRNRRVALRQIKRINSKIDDERAMRVNEITTCADVHDALRKAVLSRLNVVVSGGTSSGKTTVARAMLDCVRAEERMITIEDAPELDLTQRNSVAMISERNAESPRSPKRLLQSALRMRPDRIVLGELRGDEAPTYLEALNTGHPGSITTLHANSSELALDRLAFLCASAGMSVERSHIINHIRRTLDLVVQVGRGTNGERGIVKITATKDIRA